MNKTIYAFSLFLLISFTSVKGQTIEQLGHYSTGYEINALSSKTNLMVLGNGDIVDISNPFMLELRGTFPTMGYGSFVLVNEDYLYFGDLSDAMGISELNITDISNPLSPVQKSSLKFNAGGDVREPIKGIVKIDNILYLAMRITYFYSIDVSNSTTPLIKDSIEVNHKDFGVWDIGINPTHVFIVMDDGVKIIDISNPSDMQVVASIGCYDSSYTSIDLNDNLLFLGKNKYDYIEGKYVFTTGIDVFNISDPLNPSPVFSIPTHHDNISDLKYHDNHILVVDNLGLSVYKIENNAGQFMAQFPGEYSKICLQDSLILLAGSDGVDILHTDFLSPLGINALLLNKQIKIFPNPAKGLIEINQGNMTIKEIEIFDMKGILIHQEKYNCLKRNIDISDLPIGQYIIMFKTNESIITEKFIKGE